MSRSSEGLRGNAPTRCANAALSLTRVVRSCKVLHPSLKVPRYLSTRDLVGEGEIRYYWKAGAPPGYPIAILELGIKELLKQIQHVRHFRLHVHVYEKLRKSYTTPSSKCQFLDSLPSQRNVTTASRRDAPMFTMS